MKSETVVSTETCLHNISAEAVALKGWTCGLQWDEATWTNIDAWCRHTVKVDGQCLPDVELLT